MIREHINRVVRVNFSEGVDVNNPNYHTSYVLASSISEAIKKVEREYAERSKNLQIQSAAIQHSHRTTSIIL